VSTLVPPGIARGGEGTAKPSVTFPIGSKPVEITAQEAGVLIQNYLDQSPYKEKVKSMITKPGSGVNKFTVSIEAIMPDGTERRELLVTELKRKISSALAPKNAEAEQVDVKAA
jgi:hypothetical protein